MKKSGADIARIGFRDQAVVMLYLGLPSDDWDSVEAEPEGDDKEKVDLSWVVAGELRGDQVKSYTIGINQARIETWCRQLKDTPGYAKKRVVFVGPLGTRAKSSGVVEGVEYMHLSDRMGALRDAVLLLMARYQQGLGDVDILPAVLERVVTAIDTKSIGGYTWTRESLQVEVRGAFAEEKAVREKQTENWRVALERTLFVRRSGMTFEVVKYSVTNATGEPRRPKLTVEWTDAAETRFLHYECTEAKDDQVNYAEDPSANPFWITTWVEAAVNPGESVSWGFILARAGLARRVGRKWVLSDPLSPIAVAHEAHVVLIVESVDKWLDTAPDGDRTGNVIEWTTLVVGGQQLFHAEWIAGTREVSDGTREEIMGRLLSACESIGLAAVPTEVIDYG